LAHKDGHVAEAAGLRLDRQCQQGDEDKHPRRGRRQNAIVVWCSGLGLVMMKM
jgi:hypothetical protein